VGIREALLLLSVPLVCLSSLVAPRIALYGYLWYGLMRPDILAFVESQYPISTILVVFTLIAALRNLDRLPILLNTFACRTLMILQIPLAISFFFAVDLKLSVDRYSDYVRMIAMILCMPLIIRTEEHLRELMLVIIFSLGVIALKFGGYGILHGGVTLIGGYGHMMDDNNFLALVLAMLVPLAWYYFSITQSRCVKGALIAIIATSIAQIIMSNSRGGSLSLGLGILLIVLRTRHKLASAAVLAGGVAVAIYLVQDTYFQRMDTLRSVKDEASAASRIVHATAALNMWTAHPVIGVGFGGLNYAALSTKYQEGLDGAHVAHNTYLQMLVDSGIIAFLIYIWLLLGSIRYLGKSAACWKRVSASRAAIPYALQTSLAVFMLGGTFYSCHRMDLPYILLICGACWESTERNVAADEDSKSYVAVLPTVTDENGTYSEIQAGSCLS